MRRWLILSLAFLVLAGQASSQFYDGDHEVVVQESSTVQNPNGEITYGEEVQITAQCDPNTGTCTTAGSGGSRDVSVSCGEGNIAVDMTVQIVANNLVGVSGFRVSEIPGEIYCGLGTHELELIDPSSGQVIATDTFEVNSFNMQDPNKGDYIVVRMDEFTGNGLNDFFLTNDPWEDGDGGVGNTFVEDNDASPVVPDGASFLFANHIDDLLSYNYLETGVLTASYGQVIETDQRFGSYLDSSNTFDSPDEGWYAVNKPVSNNDDYGGKEDVIWHVADKQFASGMNMKMGRSTGCRLHRGTPGGGDYRANNCAPVHEDGTYQPEGEIIPATSFSKDSFYSSGNEGEDDYTNFYVCRGDYKGASIQESKVVKVQDDSVQEWTYYRCNMNGEWVKVTCEPGRAPAEIGSGLECRLADTVFIEADYFNIDSAPYNAPENGYLAGLRVQQTEIQKYQDVIGAKPEYLDAECWMGEDNNRPSDETEVAVASARYGETGFGDIWFITGIPPRSGDFENDTYSCIWGLRNENEGTSINVLESGNNLPVKARDGSNYYIDYGQLEEQRGYADVDTSTTRAVWSKYEAPSDGGYDGRSYIDPADNPFMLNGEYPYCDGNSFLDTNTLRNKNWILQNIECSGDGGYGGYPDTYN